MATASGGGQASFSTRLQASLPVWLFILATALPNGGLYLGFLFLVCVPTLGLNLGPCAAVGGMSHMVGLLNLFFQSRTSLDRPGGP